MNRIDVFGNEIEEKEEEQYKVPSISPFDFLNSINYTKENLIVDEWSEKQYIPFIVNKGLSYSADTAIQANEMNSRPHLEKSLQYQFLMGVVRKRKRFNKWMKPVKRESIDIIKEYYGYSTRKAEQVLELLDNYKINELKQKLIKDGSN